VNVSGGTPPTLDAISAAWLTGPKSDNAYQAENSYGLVSYVGKTYGPFPYAMTTCDTTGLATALRPMIPTADGCQHYAWVMSKVTACAWAGLGQVGTADKPAKDTWYNGTTSCTAAIQEVEHNNGMQHSSSISCGATIATGAITDVLTNCTHSEYGDKSDTLGSGCRHMNAWQKLYQKWWGGQPQGGPAGSCNAVSLNSQGTFTFNLYPTETPCNGVQAIEIKFPTGKTRAWQGVNLTSWYLEFRAPYGAFDGSPAIAAQVQARLGVAPVLPTQTGQRGVHTWITNPGTGTANMALTAGTSFTDPAGGMTVNIVSITNANAVVTITLDAAAYPATTGPVCLDGSSTPFTPPGPTDCTAVANPVDGGVITPPPTGTTVGAGGRGGAGGAGGGGAGGVRGDSGAIATPDSGQPGAGGSGQDGSVGGGEAGSGQSGGAAGGSEIARPAHSGPIGDLEGGCACRIETSHSTKSHGALFALAIGGLLASRRRRQTKAGPKTDAE
jgi:MYXO-CTERM domain-containing protein